MNFLKKFGIAVAKVVGVVTGFGPLLSMVPMPEKVSAVVTRVIDTFTGIAAQVMTVEAVFAAINDPSVKTGPDKLKAATPLVAQVIQQADFMVGKRIKDPALFTAGCQKVTGGMADILNSLEEVATAPVPPPA